MITQATKNIATMAALAIGVTFIMPETTSAGDYAPQLEMAKITEAAESPVAMAYMASATVRPTEVDGKVKFVSTIN